MEVIEMLRSATGPDRALDNEIAIAIGLNVPSDPAEWPPRFSASIDAALSLVPEGHYAAVGWTTGVPTPFAQLDVPSGDIAKRFVTLAATPAIALCVAALEARKAMQSDEPAEGLASDVIRTRESAKKRIAEARQEIEDGARPRKKGLSLTP